MLVLPADPGRRFRRFGIRLRGEESGRSSSTLGTPDRAKPYFDYYHLSDIERVSDPEASLYSSPVFQIRRNSVFSQFLIPGVWKAWLLGAVRQHGLGMIQEDADQMPAVFYLRERVIAREYQYKTIADRPDY